MFEELNSSRHNLPSDIIMIRNGGKQELDKHVTLPGAFLTRRPGGLYIKRILSQQRLNNFSEIKEFAMETNKARSISFLF